MVESFRINDKFFKSKENRRSTWCTAQHAAKIIFAVSEVSKEVVYGALKKQENSRVHKDT